MRRLGPAFFRKSAERVARDLIGTVLVRRYRGKEYHARIVETEAYVGSHDLASHSSKGRTERNQVMFGPPGHAYVYLIYGMYEMFNIVTGRDGNGEAVLIRAAEPLDGWKADLSGPGKLSRAFKITRALNGLDLTGDSLYLRRGRHIRPTIAVTTRIGVDYAKEWKHALLRFIDRESPALSRR